MITYTIKVVPTKEPVIDIASNDPYGTDAKTLKQGVKDLKRAIKHLERELERISKAKK